MTYDLLIIGAGPGGYVCAIRAAQLGMSVAIIEKRGDAKPRLGGTCLNVGCIPSKALLDSSERYQDASKHFAGHGIQIKDLRIDVAQMMKRKNEVVTSLTDGIAYLMKKNKITVIAGTGHLDGTGKVSVRDVAGKEQKLEAKHVVLAMGSLPVALPFLPIDGERILTSDHAIALPEVPKHLIVVGGGVIGLELGSVWARLGAKVTVVEFLPQICPFLDADVAKDLQRSLGKQGLDFALATKVTAAETTKTGVTLTATDSAGKTITFTGDRVLVAVGRRPLSDGLAEVGVALTERKQVRIDERYTTNLPGVYAIGDLVPGPMLAHKAEEEGVALAEMLAGQKPHLDHNLIPNVIYTHPEVATIGLTEREAGERGLAIAKGRFGFAANGRAKAAGESEGYVKLLADAKTDRLLGAAIFGPRASDLIAEVAAVMAFGGSSEDLARICHAHPTFSEAVKEAALDTLGRVMHS